MAESFYEGTWASGALPSEIPDFELMLAFKWSYEDLQKTPSYVRRFTWDLLLARRAAEAAAKAKGNRG